MTLQDLTADDRSIVGLLISGHTDEQMARLLACSPRTIRRRVTGLMERLGATSRFQAGYLVAGITGFD